MHWKPFSSVISHLNSLRNFCLNPSYRLALSRTLAAQAAEGDDDDHLYADVPRPPRSKTERKPYPTPMKILIRRAKQEREARKAQPCKLLEEPPENGLLVPELVEVAHRVYRARESILLGLSKLVNVIPVLRCRHCHEVHIGHVGHEIRTCTGPKSGLRSATHIWRRGRIQDVIFFPKCYHLYDRVGKPRVSHTERSFVKQIPAIVELCIQAGVNIGKYPTKRRTQPVYSLEGRIVDFESQMKKDIETKKDLLASEDTMSVLGVDSAEDLSLSPQMQMNHEVEMANSLRELSTVTLDSWFEMISGANKIMERYKVHTCGYCPEIQVGPKGHKVRMCKASKHQSRNGMHAWQEATINDLVWPNYVWHVADLSGPPLANGLKRYYGKAPAVVELCVQGGAPVPAQYRSMMRLDVVPPSCDELDLVT